MRASGHSNSLHRRVNRLLEETSLDLIRDHQGVQEAAAAYLELGSVGVVL